MGVFARTYLENYNMLVDSKLEWYLRVISVAQYFEVDSFVHV